MAKSTTGRQPGLDGGGRRGRVGAGQKLLRPASWRLRVFRIALLWALVVALCSFLDLRGFDFLEQYADDMRVKVYARRYGSLADWARQRIIIVARSDSSFEELNNQPLPRSYHAKVIRELTRAGAKVIAFDFFFTQPREHDGEMIAATRASGRVLWAGLVQNNPDDRQIILPTKQLLGASPHWGHTYAPLDAEQSTVKRIPAVLDDHGKQAPALSVQMARMALGQKDEALRRTASGWQAGEFSVPVEKDGTFRIKYLGSKPGDVFNTIPYEAVYGGLVDSPMYQQNKDDPELSLRDKIVLIGDITTAGNDHRATPLGEMYGVEIHAHALATLLLRSFVHKAAPWQNVAVLCLLAALVCPIAAAWRAQWAALATGALLLGYLAFNVWLFIEVGTALHLIAPLAAMTLAMLAVMIERSLTVEREKNRTSGLLSRYVSPQIAGYILANPDKCFLGGTRVTATVLFSDIRGFTALAEKLSPEEVLGRLNEYLQAMTDTVFAHDGTVDKYMGDSIMALFGTPVPYPNHARRAVATAIDMQSALMELQTQWRKQGLPQIDIGIGINTGEMIFGNIGANERMDFSVIGDAVNLASRVESLNKELNTRILITDSTYEFVKDEVSAHGPILARIRGKNETTSVYEIFGWNTGGGGALKAVNAVEGDADSAIQDKPTPR